MTSENAKDFLNEKFFQKVIKNHLNYDIDTYNIRKIEINPATKSGDNYLSIMFRVSVTIEISGNEELLSYIVKALMYADQFKELVDGFSAFPKEIEMLSNILPAFEKIWKDVGEEVNFGPK